MNGLTGDDGSRRLRLLSFNIQSAITTRAYSDYVTQAWKQVLPARSRGTVLARIAAQLAPYDIVALQEIDGGSLRSGFVDQARHLAELGGFTAWHHLANRRLGRLAQHGIALLARQSPLAVEKHRLPGMRGRGALLARFGDDMQGLCVVVAHLALGRRSRMLQAAYLAELIGAAPRAVLMGDLNCDPHGPVIALLTARTALRPVSGVSATFPSWRPRRHIDHILATPALQPRPAHAPHAVDSDHLPVAAEIRLR